MALTRLLLAWSAVGLWTLLWWTGERGLRRLPPRAALGPALPGILTESLLLTLFAGLWFASLGSGGTVLLFLVVGGLMELPWRLASAEPIAWKAALAGIARVTLSGVILGQLLG
ncbi:MAG TPA: hypothetical protein VNH46_10375 [Gemmatimonadales bacterium]|nr:hypothetical protein [Gemmatimonadales bacterium]